MNNYEYIVASLPVVNERSAGKVDADEIVAEIRSQLSGSDCALLDTFIQGCSREAISPELYERATRSSNRFIREYFTFDLAVRNAKVDYLNKALGRPYGQDKVILGEEEPDFDEREKVDAVLNGSDILERERGLDDIMWEKIDDITRMDIFDIEFILGFVAKLMIIDRWNKLDPQTGREMFRRLVEEIRKTR